MDSTQNIDSKNDRTTNTMEQKALSDAPIYMNIRGHHKVSSTQNATNKEESTESPIYDHIDMNPMQESSKKSDLDLDSYIAMILHAGKESHAGATYQSRDFSAVCIDDDGGVVSLDYYGVTLLLPLLSLQESCVTIFLYMERTTTKRVHGNPTYASPVIRVGCISKNMSTLTFKEHAILSLPLFNNKHILPFYQQGEKFTEVWTGLSDENTSISDGVRCTISIDKTGLYTCLNYTSNDIEACATGRRVLPVQCSAFVGRLSTEDVRIEVAFWLSSETQLAVIQKQNTVHMNLCDGSRELLIDVSHTSMDKSLVVDVTGTCDGWIVYGGKQKHIPLSTIHEELKRPDSLYTVDFKFTRNTGYEGKLSCKLRTYIKDHGGERQRLALFRFNCMRKSSTPLDLTVEKVENSRCTVQNPGPRNILDIFERCLEHVTKIISSNLNGVWEKRFAESLNIPASLVKSAEEICLIEKALYVFIGSRIATMADNDIVFDFISASNNIYKELESEATERRKNHAAKSLSLPQGAKLTKPRYRTTSCSDDMHSAHLSRNPVTPAPRRQSVSYHWCPEMGKVVCCDKDVAAASPKCMLPVHEDNGTSSSNHHYEESNS
ncbi:uncharacterized protein LOC117120692 isoform X2 [Anneissia japonica]|uniref:uncharacterized protein LOC117120692 isoform X2 n=1 Tax=Anneissia japonica TaxID=1529436 RepID=UPI001425AFED|nr:uncharacterized protein LOC117120692 isoform X2 [Anneissia japonica]